MTTGIDLGLYVLGVGTGMLTMWIIYHYWIDYEASVAKQLSALTIAQHEHLRATHEVVDEETADRIKQRASERLEEIDLDVVAEEVSDS